MRKNLRGKVAVLLAAAMMCGSLAGCAGETQENSIAAVEDTDSGADQAGSSADKADSGADQAGSNSDKADSNADEGDSSTGKNETVDMEQEGAQSESAMGRYMESEIPLPEGMQQYYAGRKLADGRLRVFAHFAEQPGVYDSTDDGATWTEAYQYPEEYKDAYVNVAAMSETGAIFCNLAVGEPDEEGVSPMGGAEFSPEGEFSLIPLEIPDMGNDEIPTYMTNPVYAEEGKILVSIVGSDQIFLFDTKTGEKLRVYNEDEKPLSSFKKVGNDIYIFTDDSVRMIDYESGEETAVDEVLKNMLESREENFFEINFYTYPILFCEGQQEGELYFCNAEGIYRYMKGGSLVEQLADGKLNSLAKPSMSLMSMEALEDGSFLVFAYDEDTKLLHYVYNADVPTTPDTVLNVYSLQENQDVQQAISMFQNQNPNYYVNMEVGMSGDDAVTASDALRTLNTELMAGNGPDILILDGMPMESYMEKGILTDMSALIQEVEAEGELFDHITHTYEQDGAIYAVPSRFKVPIIQGSQESLDAITDLASLQETAASLRAENSDIPLIMNVTSIYWMIKEFYTAYSPALIQEDGSLNEEALTELLVTMKEIFDLNQYKEEEKVYRYDVTDGGAGGYDYTSFADAYEWLTDSTLLDNCNVGDGMGFAEIISIGEQKNLSYKLSPFSGKNVFVPSTIVGISSRSQQQEGAEEFVKFLLSREAQDSSQGGGFPINKGSFEQGLVSKYEFGFGSSGWTTMDEDGNMQDVNFDILNPSEEAQEQFIAQVESLDTPSLTDAVIEELIETVAGRYVKGEIFSVEDAVSEIQQKMSLYLAE